MKHSMPCIILCMLLTLSLTACGKEAPAAQSDASLSTPPETFGVDTVENTPVEEAQTTALPADSSLEPAAIQDPSPLSEPPIQVQDQTQKAVIAVIIAQAIDHLEYSPTDDQYLWRAVGYLAGQLGTDGGLVLSDESGLGRITQETASVLAYAVNSGFSGQLPVVTEEDPLISKTEDGNYLINLLSQGSLELSMTENRYTSQEDTITEEAELFQDGVSLGSYTVTLTKYTGNTQETPCFAYSIAGLSPAGAQ